MTEDSDQVRMHDPQSSGINLLEIHHHEPTDEAHDDREQESQVDRIRVRLVVRP
jgi:hypothetical protein